MYLCQRVSAVPMYHLKLQHVAAVPATQGPLFLRGRQEATLSSALMMIA